MNFGLSQAEFCGNKLTLSEMSTSVADVSLLVSGGLDIFWTEVLVKKPLANEEYDSVHFVCGFYTVPLVMIFRLWKSVLKHISEYR